MTTNQETTLPCKGVVESDGCDLFERYYLNESLRLESVHQGTDQPCDEDDFGLAAILDSPEELRNALHQAFVESGFCVLALERQKAAEMPKNVISITRKQDVQNLQFAGCHFAHLASKSD